MYYSITFTDSNNVSKNTWTDWGFIPATPPMIVPPEPYTNYVDIPGRIEGPIDLSEVLTNGVSYQNSQGSWSFISTVENENRMAKFHEIKDFLHGQKMMIQLEEDPGYYYIGRLFLSGVQTGKGPNTYEIKYIIEPNRYLLPVTEEPQQEP